MKLLFLKLEEILEGVFMKNIYIYRVGKERSELKKKGYCFRVIRIFIDWNIIEVKGRKNLKEGGDY